VVVFVGAVTMTTMMMMIVVVCYDDDDDDDDDDGLILSCTFETSKTRRIVAEGKWEWLRIEGDGCYTHTHLCTHPVLSHPTAPMSLHHYKGV